MTSDRFFRLDAGYQQYDWGKIGSSSAVAKFAAHSDPSVKIDETKPYAELWMGTHPKVPSLNHDTKVSLNEILAKNPTELLGKDIIEKFQSKDQLPFLFKVLSIEKVLSIQAHPDKALGKKLHMEDPANYPDDNHKPEMAVAITEFEGFCGFKPLEEIAEELQSIPEFRNVVGTAIADDFTKNYKSGVSNESSACANNKKLLQKVFEKVMTADCELLAENADGMAKRAQEDPQSFTSKSLPDLVVRLNRQFPRDVGLFCGCLMLNHCKLQPGQALFLEAKDPHAYIYGDIIECMAASDNVVRAGFTPKFKDVKNLVEMLTYRYDPVEKQVMAAEDFPRSKGDGESILYNPPIAEFSVLETTFKKNVGTTHIDGLQGPSIIITTAGEGYVTADGKKLKAEPGFVFFVAPNVEVELETTDKNFTTYRAFVEA
ncbi:mannose-6-phosphate isomerase PMI40 RNJ42_04932 [Nakaseomyces bracarensis]|uniref:mannose-6-phosphate isomerase PMI40 n=1 Tax=Nakaseomyces bracarensis TaxID=273131 RepID=UPI0038714420